MRRDNAAAAAPGMKQLLQHAHRAINDAKNTIETDLKRAVDQLNFKLKITNIDPSKLDPTVEQNQQPVHQLKLAAMMIGLTTENLNDHKLKLDDPAIIEEEIKKLEGDHEPIKRAQDRIADAQDKIQAIKAHRDAPQVTHDIEYCQKELQSVQQAFQQQMQQAKPTLDLLKGKQFLLQRHVDERSPGNLIPSFFPDRDTTFKVFTKYTEGKTEPDVITNDTMILLAATLDELDASGARLLSTRSDAGGETQRQAIDKAYQVLLKIFNDHAHGDLRAIEETKMTAIRGLLIRLQGLQPKISRGQHVVNTLRGGVFGAAHKHVNNPHRDHIPTVAADTGYTATLGANGYTVLAQGFVFIKESVLNITLPGTKSPEKCDANDTFAETFTAEWLFENKFKSTNQKAWCEYYLNGKKVEKNNPGGYDEFRVCWAVDKHIGQQWVQMLTQHNAEYQLYKSNPEGYVKMKQGQQSQQTSGGHDWLNEARERQREAAVNAQARPPAPTAS